MRLFTGIDLPAEIKQRLDALIKHLRNYAQINWSPAANLHVTTKFIGEWPPERLDEVAAALRTVTAPSRIDIDIHGLGWFPNPHNPRVFWAAVHASPSLAELAQATDEALHGLGVELETRPYSPHLTLARIKGPSPLTALRQAIAKLESVDFGAFTPSNFHLYRSQPGSGGSVYTKLFDFPLPTA
jgi:2'-5' RNA ligase